MITKCNINKDSFSLYTSILLIVPTQGVELVQTANARGSLIVETKYEKGLQFKHKNGIISKYKILINPGNRTYEFTKHIFEFASSLIPNTQYVIQGKASTKVGYGPYGPKLVVRTAEDTPSAPVGVDAFEIKGGSGREHSKKALHIIWKEPKSKNGNITFYSIEVVLKNGTTLKYRTLKESPFYFIVQVQKSAVRKITVYAHTKEGRGPPSLPYFPMDESPLDQEGEDLNKVVLIVAVAFAIIFMVVLCILVIILIRR